MTNYLFLFFLLFFNINSYGQSTTIKVYQLFQTKCATPNCHNNGSQIGGLDLEGTAITEAQRAIEVRNNIFNITPNNTTAQSAGHSYVYPGRVDKSYLFQKINDGLEPTLETEIATMPPVGSEQLTNEEKELVRQWILQGAPESGDVVDEQLISDFYNLNGQKSFPNGIPPAPAESEGFQIKMGPFFIEPGEEVELFQKYEIDLPDNVEITRIETIISNYSHHFVLSKYTGDHEDTPHGLRTSLVHAPTSLVAAVQSAFDLRLPYGTALFLNKNEVLDLNTHYINYSPTSTYEAEVYLNIYTQPSGIASQEMKIFGESHTNLASPLVPNDGNEYTYEQILEGFGPIYLWGIMGHTHKYGVGYKTYNYVNGEKEELLYDASCPQGIPGCAAPFYDFSHIPVRYFSPLKEIGSTSEHGLLNAATYVNNSSAPVFWGNTSEDEMMALVLMYVTDTLGLSTSITGISNPLNDTKIYPNPMIKQSTIEIPKGIGTVRFEVYDMLGKLVHYQDNINENQITFKRNNLVNGMYLYRVQSQQGHAIVGKIVLH